MATTFDKASLVMIPSGYKDDKLYSIKPTDGSGDFTFSRDGAGASPATRVNASGLIEKGRENLILQSNTFSTTWTNVNTSETGGQSGYDGSSDAWLLDISGGSNSQRIEQTISNSGVQTFSVYVKAGTLNWVALLLSDSTTSEYAFFDLQNGVLGSAVNSPIDHNIESVGGGWYRCSLTSNMSALSAKIYPATADGNTNQSSGNIYIQDAQLEQGLVATDYIETTTSPVSAGLLGDMPRLDYSGGATCPSLLLEPSRTNIVTQSEYFDAWSKVRASISSNQAVSPEGVTNAAKLVEDTSNNSHYIDVNPNITFVDNGVYTYSCFFKSAERNQAMIVVRTKANTYPQLVFNLTDGSVVTESLLVDKSIEDYGNGWWRASITYNVSSGASTPDIYLQTALNDATSYQGDGTSGIYIYGAMVELGSYPTSYIPTYGEAEAAERAEDDCNKTGITSLIGQTEGVLFVEFEFSKDIDSPYRISLSDGTTANRIQLGTYGDAIQVYVQTGGATQVYEVTGTLSVGTTYKAALAYKANDYVCYLNGSQLFTDTSASVPACSKLGYEIPDGTGLFEHPIKQQVLFPTRLTNAELAALTA